MLHAKQHLQANLSWGHLYTRRKDFSVAIENFQKALKLALEITDETNLNEANLQLGKAYKTEQPN